MHIRHQIHYTFVEIFQDIGWAILKHKVRGISDVLFVLLGGSIVIVAEYDFILGNDQTSSIKIATFIVALILTVFILSRIIEDIFYAYWAGEDLAERDFHDHLSGHI